MVSGERKFVAKPGSHTLLERWTRDGVPEGGKLG